MTSAQSSFRSGLNVIDYVPFNYVLKDNRPDGGDVLTDAVLSELKPVDAPKVIYGHPATFASEMIDHLQAALTQFEHIIDDKEIVKTELSTDLRIQCSVCRWCPRGAFARTVFQGHRG